LLFDGLHHRLFVHRQKEPCPRHHQRHGYQKNHNDFPKFHRQKKDTENDLQKQGPLYFPGVVAQALGFSKKTGDAAMGETSSEGAAATSMDNLGYS
jgi:hypothetical protein